jgi:predicted component of type VI protein secretion system
MKTMLGALLFLAIMLFAACSSNLPTECTLHIQWADWPDINTNATCYVEFTAQGSTDIQKTVVVPNTTTSIHFTMKPDTEVSIRAYYDVNSDGSFVGPPDILAQLLPEASFSFTSKSVGDEIYLALLY